MNPFVRFTGVSAVFFALATACISIANYFIWRVVDAVNAELPASERFSQWWWYPGKGSRVADAYRRLCPGSRDLYWARVFQATGTAFGVLLVISLGFFRACTPT